MIATEPTNIGLSEGAHGKLKRLKEDGHFNEMADAYRFAIALALAHGVVPPELPAPRANIFGVATIDMRGEIYNAIKALMDTREIPVYRWAERLAEWGVEELARQTDMGDIDFSKILEETERLGTAA